MTVFTACPRTLVPADVWEAVDFAEMARKGAWPEAGGLLDQTAIFADAARLAWGYADHFKALLRTPPDHG